MHRIAMILWSLGLLVLSTSWKSARPDYEWSFPRDHWAHPGYRTEWWYFTGHLNAEGDPERRFGYQFTFFRIGVVEEPLELDSDWAASSVLMGHAAVTDVSSNRHVFTEVLYRAMPLLAAFQDFPERRIAWSRGPAGTDALWTLDWNGQAFDFSARDEHRGLAFELSTKPRKPLVLQGPNGFSRKGDAPGAASHYYSFTRLDTAGTVEIDGERFRVSGTSWMDKEFSSSQLGEDQVGWDWFSLVLDDGRELMLYLMRSGGGSIDYAHGTLVEAASGARYLGRGDFEVRVLDTWESPETKTRYPSRWRILLPAEGIVLEVVPLVADQENRSRLPGGVHYWEGAVSLLGPEGEPRGQGYVEMTGYGEDNRPPV